MVGLRRRQRDESAHKKERLLLLLLSFFGLSLAPNVAALEAAVEI
jgi:hypothetical protein